MKSLAIVTVCKDDLCRLRKTVESVVNQCPNACQYVIKDGGSRDGTLEFLGGVDSSQFEVYSSPDSGIFSAFQHALERIESEYVLFLNCGDVLLRKNSIKHIMDNMVGGDIVFFPFRMNTAFSEELFPSVFSAFIDGLRRLPGCHQAMVYRTEVLRKFNFDPSYKLAGDFEQFLRAFQAGCSVKIVRGEPIVDVERGGAADSARFACTMEHLRALRSVRQVGIWECVRMMVYGVWIQFKYYIKVALKS